MKTEQQKESARLASKRWRERHPEQAKEVNRQGSENWRLKNPEVSRSRNTVANLKRRYGLSMEEHDTKLESQNNLCALCNKPFDLSKRGTSPALDHCHDSNNLRDFIHHTCNVAIGLLQDDPELCRLAALYLEKHL